ncbi:MAG: 2-amino-4-hydroxy-6-hydroxymethyldihydropteridine diphosphokinase [Lentimicrobiaceae bacterium]|nr:2-amino-4-hydroxy-6-hydroxymethyldihydropteridine diphosphokinase [Lentimicrobiaceae bacterium]
MAIVYLSIGSNVGDRLSNIINSVKLIEDFAEVINYSSIIETKPWGYNSDNLFLNAAIKIKTELSCEMLLQKLLSVEKTLGRVKTKPEYEDRIIDIDILFYDKTIVKSKSLTIPHPHIQDRRFVLEPLNSICPNFKHPVLNLNINTLLKRCPDKLLTSMHTSRKQINQLLKNENKSVSL